MRILGIDPGTNRMGYAIINDKPLSVLKYGLIEIKDKDHSKIFPQIEKRVSELIKIYRPDVLALETIYFSKNQKTALSISEIRGIVKLLAFKNKIMVNEIGPKTLKMATTGYGLADKKSVAKMIKMIFHINKNLIDDITDALALAYCGINKIQIHTLS